MARYRSETVVSAGVAAELLELDPRSVHRLVTTGKLRVFARTLVGGHARFELAEVVALRDARDARKAKAKGAS